MAGKITTNSVVLGDSVTDTQNFVLKTNADGTATLARGALGALGTVFGVNGSGALTGATLVSPTITGLTAAALPAGSVLQVVNATTSTSVSSSSSAYADTGLTATITPTSATSKILVLINHSSVYKTTNNTGVKIQLLRNATSLMLLAADAGDTGSVATNNVGSVGCNYSDSPATTSSTTYKTQFASRQNNATAIIGYSGEDTSTMTLMEIAG